MRIQLNIGDEVAFTQDDGRQILLLVYPDGIGVKAEQVCTELEVTRESSIFVRTKAVNKHKDADSSEVSSVL